MDPNRRRFEHFTSSELKDLKQAMYCWKIYYGPNHGYDLLTEEIDEELGERFNDLQESRYVG